MVGEFKGDCRLVRVIFVKIVKIIKHLPISVSTAQWSAEFIVRFFVVADNLFGVWVPHHTCRGLLSLWVKPGRDPVRAKLGFKKGVDVGDNGDC